MDTAFVILLLFALSALCLILLRNLRHTISELTDRLERQDRIVQTLLQRIYKLETRARPDVSPPVVQEISLAEPQPAATPAGVDEGAEATPPSMPEAPWAPPPDVKPAEDWEAIIGGNWLNKLGVLILVVGIALFLGYSLTQLGPAGKIAIGFAVGVSMLVGGLRLQESPRYVTFSRGLIGGGWAAIYFTAYAMHGLPAARVIESPILGTAILLAVSAGMIAHSFLYRSQPVTAVAFLTGFVSLNLSPLTPFAVLAAVVLAVAAMIVAARFAWYGLAIAGVILTYFTYSARYELSIYGQPGVLNGLVVLWTYWITFEVFDLIDLRRRGLSRGYSRFFFTANAAGFLLSATVHETALTPHNWGLVFSAAAASYAASAAARHWLTRSPTPGNFLGRLFGGNWEGAVAAAVAYTCAAQTEFVIGLPLTGCFLVTGQIVVIAGLLAKDRYLTTLGGMTLILPVFHLLTSDVWSGRKFLVFGHWFQQWSPMALLIAAVYSVNRFLTRAGTLYSFGASLLIALVIGEEVPKPWLGLAWAVLFAAALSAGCYWRKLELRIQAYLLTCAAFFSAMDHGLDAPELATRVISVGAVAALFYCGQFLLRHFDSKDWIASPALSVLGTTCVTALIGAEVQGRVLTVALGIQGISLVIFGFLTHERILRLSGLFLFLVCIGKLFIHDLSQLDTMSRILSFIVLGLMLLGASWVYTRFREQVKRLL